MRANRLANLTALPSGAVHLAGSTTMVPRMRRLAEAYMDALADRAIVVVEGGGTTRGYKAVLDGTTDIAMASGPAPEAYARAPLRGVTIGIDQVDILVHAANPVAALGATQLTDILTGRIRNWREVGGIDSPIAVFVGPPGGGLTASIRHAMGPDTGFTPGRQVLAAAERLRRTGADRTAITYATGPLPAGLAVKALAIDGRTGGMPGYPIRAPFALLVAGQATAAAQAFIDYAAARWQGPGLPAHGAA